jgi:glycosyltransferase involved in cell wall biosynthesis
MYGSNGHKQRPRGPVIAEYIRRERDPNPHVKCFVRPDAVADYRNPHSWYYRGMRCAVTEVGKKVTGSFSTPPIAERAWVNHYHHKSDEDYFEKAAKRSVADVTTMRYGNRTLQRHMDGEPKANAVIDDSAVNYYLQRCRSLPTDSGMLAPKRSIASTAFAPDSGAFDPPVSRRSHPCYGKHSEGLGSEAVRGTGATGMLLANTTASLNRKRSARQRIDEVQMQSGRTPVSVVLTTYNRASFVGRTIESILAQTFCNFELIICDDSSTDSTEEICRKYVRYDGRIQYYRRPSNLGMPGNLNAGIRAATGDYLANLHDGDIYDTTLLEKWKKALDQAPGAAFVFNQYRITNPAGSEIRVYREALPCTFRGSLLIEEYFRRWRFDSPVWGTVMARRSAYFQMGLFDPRFRFIADVDMWLRLADRYDVAYVPEPLIEIPSRDVLPSNWQDWHSTPDGRMLRRIMWEARVRHYHKRPLRKNLELMRHFSFCFADSGWLTMAKAKRAIRRSAASMSEREFVKH